MDTAGYTVSQPTTSLLRNRNFVLLWSAYAISALGDHLSEMAILKTQNALSAEVDVTALNARMAFMFFLPFFVFAPPFGWLADRLSRRLLMISADLIRCAIMFFFASLIGWTQSWGTWGPFLPLLLVGGFAALFSPARSALLPTIIRPEQLVRANGMIAGLGIIATMAANLAGGYLARYYTATTAFRIDAATFLVSAVLVAFLIPPRPRTKSVDPRTAAAPLREIILGVHYVRCHKRVVQLLMVSGLVWFCGALVNSVIPAVARDVYHRDYQAMSGFRAFLGLGFILGAVALSVLGDALRGAIAITWGFIGIGVSVAVFSASVFMPFDPDSLFVIGAVGVVASGFFGIVVMASFDALLQRIVPNRVRGRVFGIRDVCTTASLLLATGLLGIPQWTRVDRWVGYILGAVAALMVLAGLVTLWVRLGQSMHGRSLTFAENLNEFMAKFWWRFRRLGRSTVPRTGPVLVTANHTCSADPLFLSAAVPYRPISFVVAAEYTNWPIVRFFLRVVECIPVKRGTGDAGATKQAIRHLRDGKAVGIFIEGGIVAPGEPVEPKDGVAMLALRTGAPVIPAYISGVTYHEGIVRGLFARHRARVRFGRPVDLSEFHDGSRNRDAIRAATSKIYAAVKALAPREEKSEECP